MAGVENHLDILTLLTSKIIAQLGPALDLFQPQWKLRRRHQPSVRSGGDLGHDLTEFRQITRPMISPQNFQCVLSELDQIGVEVGIGRLGEEISYQCWNDSITGKEATR